MTWKPNPSIIITAEQKQTEAINAAWDVLRRERDRRINETDWLVFRHQEESVKTLSDSEYEQLLSYRQTLRDLPANTTDPTSPEWPNYEP